MLLVCEDYAAANEAMDFLTLMFKGSRALEIRFPILNRHLVAGCE